MRGYVQSLLTDTERELFISAGAEMYFGRRWREGKITPRVVPVEYREVLDNRPGNEFAVIHYLLLDAKEKEDVSATLRVTALAVHYCRSLRTKDRFRDLALVAGGILQVVDNRAIPEQWPELAYLNGIALRMTGKGANAITYLRQILTTPDVQISDDVKAGIWLNIALGEETLNHEREAIEGATEVKKLTNEKDANWFQANCIIEGLEKTGKERLRRLTELAVEARGRGMTTVANNLAISLSETSQDPTEKARLLDTVLVQSGDAYNRTRAIAAKSKTAQTAGCEMMLTLSDRTRLSEAYSYAHSQRFAKLFDTCHEGMWKVLEESGDVQQLLRLFRHSSFIWRVRGQDSREAEYAHKLSTLKPPEESASRGKLFVIEVRYFWKRLRNISAGGAITPKK